MSSSRITVLSASPPDGSPVPIVGNSEATATVLNAATTDAGANTVLKQWNVWAFSRSATPSTLHLVFGSARITLSVTIPPLGHAPVNVLQDFVAQHGMAVSAYVTNGAAHEIHVFATKLRV